MRAVFKFFILFLILPIAIKSLAQPIGLRADKMTGIKNGERMLQYLQGNVSFNQNGSTVMCDNAEYDGGSQTLVGRGNVRIFSSEGVNITGNTLTYSDYSKVARVDGNVVLNDRGMVLNAPFLVYNTNSKIGHYGGGGRIVDGNQTLTSNTGTYNPNIKMLYFKGNVVVTHPDYILKSDTLQYSTANSTAYFFAYTEITDGKSQIYCNDGWYNTRTGKAFFTRKAAIYNSGQIIKSDTLTYDRETGVGYAFGNLWVNDTAENMVVWGSKAYYNQKQNITKILGNALLHRVSKIDEDSLFLRADSFTYINDSQSNKRNLVAIGAVQIWQPEFSGHCQYLHYGLEDSLIQMAGEPFLYNANTQLNSDSMSMQIIDNQLKTMYMLGNAQNILQETPDKYSQISASKITNYFNLERQLKTSWVQGNSQSIYYIREGDSSITSANKVACQDMRIQINDGKVGTIKMYQNPEGKLYPIHLFPADEAKLNSFNWQPEGKPALAQFSAPYPEPSFTIKPRK